MASVIRYLATVALATVITLSAFYLMHRLIDQESAATVAQPPVTSIHFGPVEIPEPPVRKPRKPPEQPERSQPPPSSDLVAEIDRINRMPRLEPVAWQAPGPSRVLEGSLHPPGGDAGGNAYPVAAVPPPYPRKAALQGIEGWVRLAVEIDARGRVLGVRVLDAEPRGVFEQTAIDAIRRWSWKPAIIDGRPIEQTVVQELNFRLDAP